MPELTDRTVDHLATLVEQIVNMLDASSVDTRDPDLRTAMRALKLSEETGELAAAIIGVMGQNPRKGVTHTTDDVVCEAFDVALTALVLAWSVDPGRVGDRFADHVERVHNRLWMAVRVP